MMPFDWNGVLWQVAILAPSGFAAIVAVVLIIFVTRTLVRRT
jgi:hypothetical protein